MSKRNKKSNNIGTSMHTVSYLDQQYVKSDYKKQPTLKEIVENQTKHKLLIPRSEEDQDYINELNESVVKNVPEHIQIEKCKEFFDRDWDSFVEKNPKSDSTHSPEEKLNFLCHCHNCESNFPLKNLKWVDLKKKLEPLLYSDVETLEDLHWSLTDGEYSQNESLDTKVVEVIKKAVENPNSEIFYSDDEDYVKYYGLYPMCAKYPICPSPYSGWDLWLKNIQYNKEDHKKGKYDY